MNFYGVMTAIITPFKNGLFDEDAFRKLIDWQIKEGVDGLVVCGTTGEAVTLSAEEHDRVVRAAVQHVAGRVPVIAGCGSNSTATAIKMAKLVKDAGADAGLQVTPYYNKPTQEGLYQHFKSIASMVDMPMILYNVPGRTCVNMLPDTVKRLSSIDIIIGIKEASGNLDQIKTIISETSDEFCVFSGDDSLNFDIYKAGGDGCISVASNVMPHKVSLVWDKFVEGDHLEAERLHSELDALNKIMFIETNPIPAKTSLSLMGYCKEEFRLPMTPISNAHKNELRSVLAQYRLLS